LTNRLSTVAIDLVHEIERLPASALRRVAAEAATLAVARTELKDPRLDEALQSLNARGAKTDAARRVTEQVTNELDERARDLQDLIGTGAASQSAYETAFRKARAAAAVGYALDVDPLTSAFEAVYEA
jgi:hypothetical protein